MIALKAIIYTVIRWIGEQLVNLVQWIHEYTGFLPPVAIEVPDFENGFTSTKVYKDLNAAVGGYFAVAYGTALLLS